MTSPGQPDAQQMRDKGLAILERLQSDPAFKQQVEQDPKGALTGAGIPDRAVEDFMREASVAGDVQGYMMCDHTCDWSCFITGPR
jgi:hypothetical protein